MAANLSSCPISENPPFDGGFSPAREVGGWIHCITALTCFYILASETLCDLPDWSRLGFITASLLMVSLTIGHLCGRWELRGGGWLWVTAAFLCYCCLRALPELIPTADLKGLLALVSPFVGGIAVALALQAGVPYKPFAYAIITGNLCSVVAGFYGIGTESAPGEAEVRYAGLTGNSNEFALQLTLGACLIWLFPRRAGALACLLAIGAVAFAVCMTGSRKSLVVLGFFPVLVSIQMITKIRASTLLLGGVLAAALCLLAMFLAPTVPTKIIEGSKEITAVQRALEYEGNNSFETRVDMIHKALRLWQQAPLVGNGLDAFGRMSDYGTYAHNNYAELLCGTGLLGTLLFYAMHLYILYKASQLRGPLRLYCFLFVFLLIVLDVGYVSYHRKQTIMILMVLASICGHRELRRIGEGVWRTATAVNPLWRISSTQFTGNPEVDHAENLRGPTTGFRKRSVL